LPFIIVFDSEVWGKFRTCPLVPLNVLIQIKRVYTKGIINGGGLY
jgi:hypothetical protein